MKRMLAVCCLLLFGSVASAATVQYALQQVTYSNSFVAPQQWVVTDDVTVNPKFPGQCTTCYGTLEGTGDPGTAAQATVDTVSGAVSVSGAAWHGGPQQGTEYDVLWDLSTSVGGNTLTKTSQTCTDVSGTFCQAGIQNFGDIVLATGTDPNGRDSITVTDDGSTLTIAIQRALSASTTSTFSQSYTMTFTAVPVPAAVWLFGSALGLLGWARRRAN